MIQKHNTNTRKLLFTAMSMILVLSLSALAQERSEPQLVDSGANEQTSDFVTINVKNANIAEVLKAYSLQTGQSIVVGPDVVSDAVNVRLNNIHWEEALDVILKPYGFGYRAVGDTIVISRLESIVTVEGIEPLVSEVFKLKYLDAYDVQEVCKAQLSDRGKITILATKSLPGWEFGGSGSGGAATEAGIRRRKQKEEIQKSKVLVITDVPSAITKIERILEEMDVAPEQVLIEAKFLEISNDDLSDIGLDYANALENVKQQTASSGSSSLRPTPVDLQEDILKVLNLSTLYPSMDNARAAGGYSFDSGIRLSHTQLGSWGADMLFALLEQDDSVNVLSAPRVLTINNQEAAILIGEKFPIIESETTSGSSSGVTSTSLDYYENIGIQLNVIPQVCANNFVNMIVHPAVSEIKGFEAGIVTAGSGSQSSSRYPLLKIREAETQVMIKSENTAVIGGLQDEREQEIIKKVPFLGDIPFLGRLFRRETVTSEKIDLLIFIKATIVDADSYATLSAEAEANYTARMKKAESDNQAEKVVDESDVVVVMDEMDDVETLIDTSVDAEDIISLVEDMDTVNPTNQTQDVQM